MPKAISYIRFSSGRQGSGSTTERQKALIQRWLSDHPETLLSNLSQEDLGKSGYSGAHLQHGLGRILKAIEEGKICSGDFILVEAIDRIGRLEPLDMFSLIQNIVSKNVTIVTLEDQQEYSKDDLNNNPGPLYILIGKIQQAHQYSKSLSNRITAAYEAKRRKARSGESVRIITPFWLDTEGKLIPENAETIKKCIDLYLRGYGARKIIITLMDEHPVLKGVHPSTLKRWFKHRALIGEWENKGDHIPNVFDSLIDHATFYKLQKQLNDRAKLMSPEQTYGLSGLVKCSICGARYYYRKKFHKDYYIIYANCSTYLKRGRPFCNNTKTWPYQVLMAIHDLTFDEHLATASWNYAEVIASAEIEALKAEKEEVSNQIDTLLEILVHIPKQQNTKDKIATLNDRLTNIDAKIYSFESSIMQDEVTNPLEGLDDFHTQKLLESANQEQHKLASDPIYLRETLKKSSYEILGNDDTMLVESGPANMTEFKLIRRSQKHSCYIVKQRIQQHFIPMADDESGLMHYDEETIFFAVTREGIIDSSATENQLLRELGQRDKEKPLEHRFIDIE